MKLLLICLVSFTVGCTIASAFKELSTPPRPKEVTPRTCVGTYSSDSLGVCIPKDTVSNGI